MRIALTVAAAAALVLVLGAATPAAPRRATTAVFFYGWWANRAHDGAFRHWQQAGHEPPADIASSYYPLRGAYSSASPRVLASQMGEIARAGIDEAVITWWGRGSWEDEHLGSVLAAARNAGVEPAAHLEPYPGRSAATVSDDLAYLGRRGIRDVYVYQPSLIASRAWAVLRVPAGMRLFAQTGRVGWAAAAGFDGVYTYDILGFDGSRFARLCAQARARHVRCAPSVGPGYDARRAGPDRRVKPRADGLTYDAMWLAALRARPDAVTITSFNEWHEGTQIEPARAARAPYAGYAGAWGVHGRGAACAYLWRTAQWTRAFATGRSAFLRPLARRRGC